MTWHTLVGLACCRSRRLIGFSLVAVFGGLCGATSVLAQDAAGCKDPAMFPNRIPNYNLAVCKSANDAEEFRWPGGSQQVMGLRSEYVYKVPAAPQGAAPRYVASNYANALTSIGATLLENPAKSTLGDRLTARVNIDGKEVWVRLLSETAVVGGNWTSYKLVIVQKDGGAQVVTAQKMLDELKRSGFITLYINFDNARWDLKPDSRETIGEIVSLMRAQPDLKLSIEGHTDNAGTPASNQTLSENRARAVKDAVQAGGIPGSRLSAKGYGQSAPIADNRTEEGRAKNRRVELVKQ